MPKENTHLFFAHEVAKRIENEKLKKIFLENIDYLYIGAIIPDAFLFWDDAKKNIISDKIHELSIKNLIDEARKEKRGEDVAFIFGLLTHFALDFVFHPVIIALTGDLNGNDRKKQEENIFKHQYWETYLDKAVNQKYFVKDLFKPNLIKNISVLELFCDELKISKKEAIKTFRRQLFINSLLGNKGVYCLACLLNKLGIIEKNHINLLQMNLKDFGKLRDDQETIPSVIKYFDASAKNYKETSIRELFSQSEKMALDSIKDAFDNF